MTCTRYEPLPASRMTTAGSQIPGIIEDSLSGKEWGLLSTASVVMVCSTLDSTFIKMVTGISYTPVNTLVKDSICLITWGHTFPSSQSEVCT